tara:strand:- start:322 stop:2442 length:2121 start_codon:yes stop_codon:yes gene_type:complete
MCGIEKNAITLMNALVHTVLDLPPWKSGTEFWFRASPDMLDVSANRARELLRDPSWRSAVVYRDPVERFVSAYKSKCELSDKDGREHCHKVFQTAHPKPQLVADALLSASRAPPAPRCTRFDPHWAPQACFCTGLAETFPLYSHPIEFRNLTSGLEEFFRGRVNESVLGHVRRLLRDRKAVTNGSPEQGYHLTGEQQGFSAHEMVQIRAQLREVYREDYAVLPVGSDAAALEEEHKKHIREHVLERRLQKDARKKLQLQPPQAQPEQPQPQPQQPQLQPQQPQQPQQQQPQQQPRSDMPPDSAADCLRMSDPEFDRWFEDDLPPRKAAEADCKSACLHGNEHEHSAWCVAYEFTPSPRGTCKLFDDCKAKQLGVNDEASEARRQAAAERALTGAAREGWWVGKKQMPESTLQPMDLSAMDPFAVSQHLAASDPPAGASVLASHLSGALDSASASSEGSDAVDVCFVTMVHDRQSMLSARAQTERMREVFVDFRWVHRSFACHTSCDEGWEQLPRKTYAMFSESLTWRPRCRSVAKLDADGFMCIDRLRAHYDWAQLDRAYVGKETQAQWRLGSDPTSKYFLKGHDIKLERRQHKLSDTWYMQGGAYLVGRKVIEYVAQQNYSDLSTLAWEDYSFGTWIAPAAVTVRANVPGSMECHPNKLGEVDKKPAVVFHHCKTAKSFRNICGSLVRGRARATALPSGQDVGLG